MCDDLTVVAYVNKQDGDGIPFPLPVGQQASEVGGDSRRPPRCRVSSRAVQCSGRSPQPSGSGYRDRVVSPPLGCERPASPLWLAIDQPVRNELQREAPLYCSFVLDPEAVFEDAFRHPWDDLDLYAFPPFPLVGWVVARVRETPNLSMTLVSPLLAGEGVVRRPFPTDPTTSGSFMVGPVVAAASLQQVPQRRPRAEPSCLASPPKSQALGEDLLLRCPAASVHPFPGYTKGSGCSSVVGVVEGALLQSLPLYP